MGIAQPITTRTTKRIVLHSKRQTFFKVTLTQTKNLCYSAGYLLDISL